MYSYAIEPVNVMIITILILYIFLKYHLDFEEEDLYRYMMILSVVNLIPTVIYTMISFSLGNLNHIILLLMALA
jgi:hypothetical protein